MANERTFDPQPSLETETDAVQDFETGSFTNNQFSNGAPGQPGSDTGGVSAKDVQPLNTTDNPVKEKDPGVKDRPVDESFQIFTPQLSGNLISSAVFYSVEKRPLLYLLPALKKKEEPQKKEASKQEIVLFFSQVEVPWSFQDEVNQREKKKEEQFNAGNYRLLPEKAAGRLTIKEESKSWYKIAFNGTEGYVKKEHVQIDAFDWLTKSHPKEIGEETIKSEKKKELDENLKKAEAKKIEKDEEGGKDSELKNKIFEFSRLSLKVATEERKLKEAKEDFEKRLKKREKKGRNSDVFYRRSKYTDAIRTSATALKKDIPEYNRLNKWIKAEREKLLTEEQKAIVKEYKIKILDEQENKKEDGLDPDIIIKEIEYKVSMSEIELNRYEEGKKQQKIQGLEKELENPTLNEKEIADKKEEIKKVNSPTPTTKPEDFAKKEILLYANREYTMMRSVEEEKALLHYLMKVSELSKEEKKGLFNFMVLFFKDDSRINEVFGYDGNKVDPKAFAEKFSDLEFDMPWDLTREKLNKNKESYKENRKTRRRESDSLKERRAWRINLREEFETKRREIKAPYRDLKEQSRGNRRGFRADRRRFRADKRKIRDTKEVDKDSKNEPATGKSVPKSRKDRRKDYKGKLKTRKNEFKDRRREIREEKRKTPVVLRGFWQKSRKDSRYGSINKRLKYLGNNRGENQGTVKLVRDNKSKDKSRSAYFTKDKEMLTFADFMLVHSNCYLDAYELDYLLRTEGDTERLRVKSVQFYNKYFKRSVEFGTAYQNPLFDDDPTLFYETIVLRNLLFTAFPEKYYQNDIPSKPSEVKDDLLRFWYQNDFARLGSKDESLENQNKLMSRVSQLESNIAPDKLNLDWFKLIQESPGNYLQAYELEQYLGKDDVSVSEKQEKLYAFYKLYEKKFDKPGYGFADKEALWAKWNGNPTGFFKYLYPAEYFDDKNKLVPPGKVYKDLFKALTKGLENTLKEEIAYKRLTDYMGEKAVDHLVKYKWTYGISALSAAILSDILFKDSNIYRSFKDEWQILAAYFTKLVPLDKTIVDFNKTTSWGDSQSSISDKFRITNQPPEVSPYPNPPGKSGEFKPGLNSLANNQAMFKTEPKETLPNLYFGFNNDFTKSRNKNSKLVNQTTISTNGFAQLFTPLRSKLGEDKDSYSMLAQGYPIILQNTPNFSFNKETKWEDLTLARLTGREKNEAYLNSIPDDPIFNYGAGLSVTHRPSKNVALSTSFNYAGVNAIPGMNDYKRMDLFSGKTAIAIDVNPVGYLKINSNLSYDWAYTSDLTPNPNSTNQDAVNGIGQQHVLSGNLTIGNGLWEFTGAFSDDLMKGKDATTFSLRFSMNQIGDIPKGRFVAQVFLDRRAANPSIGVPAAVYGGVKLVIQLPGILNLQPK